MSAERIKKAALLRFAAQGYEATSLAQIAGDVGIKTPSIYAHFQGKQVLFRHLVEDAFACELEEIRVGLRQPRPVCAAMRDYLHHTLERFSSTPHVRFWLRSIYLPPAEMTEEISARDRKFALALEETISSALRHPRYGLQHAVLPHDVLAAAFIGILRGMHAELLYCGRLDSTKILNALWTIFERALLEKN